jgi:hypothetical protein
MADLAFLVVTIAFFVLCVAYVGVCDRIIGPDPAPPPSASVRDAEREVARP